MLDQNPNCAARVVNGCLSTRRLLTLAGFFTLAALLALTAIDIPVAQFCMQGGVNGEFRKLLSLAEVFAHGTGVAMILLTIYVLDPVNRRKLPRLAACAFLPGLANLVFKCTIGRARPSSFLLDDSVALPASSWDTFVGLFHLPLDHRMQSFTSGHTASAVGLAIGLSWLYPRGRWLFVGFAVLAAWQRVDSGSHYVSDAFGAAALACVVAGLCVGRGGLGQTLRNFENLARIKHPRPASIGK